MYEKEIQLRAVRNFADDFNVKRSRLKGGFKNVFKVIDMILTVCPSPCIDVNMEVDSLSVGMVNKVISKKTFFTGKALNVARGLARLGARVFATGFMYEENGHGFEHELHCEGVPYKFVWNKGRMRENYKFIDRKSMLTEVNDVSPEVPLEKQEELIGLVEQMSQKCDGLILSGSLAKGMTADYYYRVLRAVPHEQIKIIDCSGERLFESLKCGVDLVKTNLAELEGTLKKSFDSKQEMLEGCREVIAKGAKHVLLSLGKKGAVITDGKKAFYSKSVNVAMNSTVGAGDGMVAAASNAYFKGCAMPEILKCGVAGGTATVTEPDSISFTKEKYEEILSSITVEEIF